MKLRAQSHRTLSVLLALAALAVTGGVAHATDKILILGNNAYPANCVGWAPLPGVVGDVTGKSNAFQQPSWVVVVKQNQTKAQMLAAIAAEKPAPGNHYVIWYAGHGNNDAGNHGQWVGIDGDTCAELTAAEFVAALGANADRTLVILDSCGGGAFKDATGVLKPTIDFITSTTGLECASDAASVTQCFLRGLNGAADANHDGDVTAQEAADYATTNCGTASQHPSSHITRPNVVLAGDKGKFPHLFYDQFTYANGNLTSFGGWLAHSSGGAKPIQVSGGAIVVQQSAGSGEDDSHSIADAAGLATTAKTYASFTLKIPPPAVIGTAQDYFVHFRPAGNDSNNFVARTWIGPPTAGGNYNLGIAAGSLTTTPIVPWPTGLFIGQTYHVVIAYDGVNGTSTLWLDPVNEASPSISSTSAPLAGRALRSFAVRQASPTGATYSEVIDNVGVGEVFGKTVYTVVPSLSEWGAMLLAMILLVTGGLMMWRRSGAAVV